MFRVYSIPYYTLYTILYTNIYRIVYTYQYINKIYYIIGLIQEYLVYCYHCIDLDAYVILWIT